MTMTTKIQMITIEDTDRSTRTGKLPFSIWALTEEIWNEKVKQEPVFSVVWVKRNFPFPDISEHRGPLLPFRPLRLSFFLLLQSVVRPKDPIYHLHPLLFLVDYLTVP